MRNLKLALFVLVGMVVASTNEVADVANDILHGYQDEDDSDYSPDDDKDKDYDQRLKRIGNVVASEPHVKPDDQVPRDGSPDDIPEQKHQDGETNSTEDPAADDNEEVDFGARGGLQDADSGGGSQSPASQSQTSLSSLLGVLNPMEAKSALNDFWSEIQGQTREFTRNITPSMQTFARRMQAAGFPAPLVHGFREIEIPAGSFLPPFVPDIPIAGPLNPATWSQEQINAILNPQLLNLMNPNTAANTIAALLG
ncbi:hypothetical protein GNI_053720 [Gregarina niphandrodes]|uniref:Transmembrane protein n=1 Tax=Gregarina niphandrodes TaxID=110365 RepID=A0A023B952_GRENI|nr:hypothetical protein GNI_053720 [Gregarina niphandrodes]EZG71054.1 hypothetical protein GNI_053720 [Gregarina niphandrodes]|eukprot:XP_011129847.1 hypothetical protein GNI_053720 [Gregarina niphandrodes]